MRYKKPEIYVERKFDKTLLSWKSRDNRLPLIVEGARQVGKSECIEHFAEGRYSSLVEINFVEKPEFKGVVRDGYSVENIIRNISQIDPRFRFEPWNTLVFFDEIQEFPDIATSLKFFAQDGRFDVICSADKDPKFEGLGVSEPVTAATPPEAFVIKYESPCCDKGLTLDGQRNETDLFGNKRVKYANVDMGALECGSRYVGARITIR